MPLAEITPVLTVCLPPSSLPADPEVDLDEEEMYPADPFCSVCRDGGNLMLCDVCDKSYHAACVQLDSVPAGTWTCPYHHCAACSEGIDRNLPSLSCSMCPTSFCSEHIPPDLRTRSDRLGCQEVMCVHCLEKEEEYEFIQRSKGKSATENSCRRAFLHRLQMVLKREGSQLTRLPIIGGRELDLYQLYTQVCKSGGIYAVLDSVGWKEIRRALRLPPTVHHQSALLKQFYLHLLYPYEKQFFPFFVQLPLKKAMATKDDDEEEEELALIAAQMAAAVPPPKKKGKSAAQQLVEEYQSSSSSSSRPVDPNVKDDTKPEDVLISLKIVGTTSMSKAKSLKGKKKAREKKKEERAREKEAREREKQKAKEKEKKTTTGKNQRAKRGRRGAASEPPPPPAAPLSAAAAAAAVGVKAPLKEHAAINIWSPTWWAQQANSSASVLRHAAAAASTTATNGPQVIDQEDIQNAVLAAAMAAANDTAAASATPSESITDRVDQPDMEVDQTDADANTQSNNNNDDDTTIADATPALASSDDAPAAAAVSSLPPSSPPAAAEPAPSVPSPALPPAEPVSTHSDVATTKRKYQEMLLASQTPVEPPAADVAEPVAVVEEHTDAPVVEPAAVPDTTNTDTTMADAAPTPVEAPAPSSPPLNDSTDAAPVAADPVPTAPAAADIISDTPADTAAPPQADDTTLPIVDDDNDSEAQANKRRKTSGASLQE